MSIHHPANPELWKGRQSSELEYWHQAVTFEPNPTKKLVGLLGYCGDEGVKRNLGRIGAAKAPDQIRKMMASMAYHLPESLEVVDFGNIETADADMESSHELITEKVKELIQKNALPVILGGGHDLAYAHGKGVLSHLHAKNEKLGIINLDAHFDLRNLNAGKGHSGSPFFNYHRNSPTTFIIYVWESKKQPTLPASIDGHWPHIRNGWIWRNSDLIIGTTLHRS